VVDDDIAHERSISLAEVLSHHGLVAKKKLLLAYTLARSFWQFYNSDWMDVRWTTETVHFFRERSHDADDEYNNGGCLLEGSPYFALSARKDDSLLSAEYLPTEYVVHRYPRVLALGTLLFEIGGRKHRKSTTRQENPEIETFEEKISYYLNDIRSALRRKTWPKLGLQEEVQQTYRIIVNNCSDPKFFETAQTELSAQESEALTIEERRAILYRRVVYPLKMLLQKLEWIDKSGNIRRHDDDDDDDDDEEEEEEEKSGDISHSGLGFRKPVAFLNVEEVANLSQTGFVIGHGSYSGCRTYFTDKQTDPKLSSGYSKFRTHRSQKVSSRDLRPTDLLNESELPSWTQGLTQRYHSLGTQLANAGSRNGKTS